MTQNVNQVKKAFHEAVNSGMNMLQMGKITFDEFAFTCAGYELQLREMGEDF